jgi:hypothetical protein
MVRLFGFDGKRYHEVVAVMLGLDEIFVKSDIGVHRIDFSISSIPLRTSSSIVPSCSKTRGSFFQTVTDWRVKAGEES